MNGYRIPAPVKPANAKFLSVYLGLFIYASADAATQQCLADCESTTIGGGYEMMVDVNTTLTTGNIQHTKQFIVMTAVNQAKFSMSGVAASFFTCQSGMTLFSPRINNVTLAGDSTSLYGWDCRNVSYQMLNWEYKDCTFLTGLANFVCYHEFSGGFVGCHFQSRNDHSVIRNGAVGSYFGKGCYFSFTGTNKAGARVAGTCVFDTCNGIDIGDWFLIAGNNVLSAGTPISLGNVTGTINGSGQLVISSMSSGCFIPIGAVFQTGEGVNACTVTSQAVAANGVYTGGVGTYNLSTAQTAGTVTAAPVYNPWCNDFPTLGYQYASIDLYSCNMESCAQNGVGGAGTGLTTATGYGAIYICAGFNHFEMHGNCSMSRDSLTAQFAALVIAESTGIQNAPVIMSLAATGTSTPAPALGAYFYSPTQCAFIDKGIGTINAGIAYSLNGYNSPNTSPIITESAVIVNGESYKRVNLQQIDQLRTGIQIYNMPASPLTPVGSAQAIVVSGYEKVTVTPAAAASISTATFTNGLIGTLDDRGRNGQLIIVAGNGNLTINHSASGANTFFNQSGLPLTPPAGQEVIYDISPVGGNYIQVGGYGMTANALPLTGGTMTGPLIFAGQVAMTAAGTTQGTATAITADYSTFSTVAAGTGAVCPVPALGSERTIVNRGANALLLYPSLGTSIDGLAVNIPVSIPPNSWIVLNGNSATQWYTIVPVYAAGTGMVITQSNNGTITLSVASTVAMIPTTYTFAALPAASSVIPYQEYQVTDVGTNGSRWYSNGTTWLPVNGVVHLFSSSVPMYVAPGGSIIAATSGSLTWGTAIDLTPGMSLVYFPASAFTSGTAGWYWTNITGSSAAAAQGTVYLQTYNTASNTPPVIPGTLTDVANGSGATFTTTAAYITGMQFVLPAGVMGANGKLAVDMLGSNNTTAGAKYGGLAFGTGNNIAFHATTTGTWTYKTFVTNLGAANKQFYQEAGFSIGNQGQGILAVATASPVTVYQVFYLATSGDWVAMNYFDAFLYI